MIDGDWLRRQLAERDPLWDDWHHNAPVMAQAAVEIFEQAGRER